jgi:SAM-dependent methyltransferase
MVSAIEQGTKNQEVSGSYASESPYTIGYFTALAPAEIVSAARAGGAQAPDIESPFTYCDFGCGRALTLLTLAAAYPDSRFYGVDIQEEFIEETQTRADAAGITNLTLIAKGFEDPALDDLPKMDFVVAHGIYTWVPEEIAEHLLSRMSSLLKKDGIAYISYNVRAGFAQLAPVRSTMQEIQRSIGADSSEGSRKIIDIIKDLHGRSLPFFKENPRADQRVSEWQKDDQKYLVHEYFADGWRLSSFAEVARHLIRHDLHFIGDAIFPGWSESKDNSWGPIKDPVTLEEIASFSLGEAFRKDIFRRSEKFCLGLPPLFNKNDRFLRSTPQKLDYAKVEQKFNRWVMFAAKACDSGPISFEQFCNCEGLGSLNPASLAVVLRRTMRESLVVRVAPEMPAKMPEVPKRLRFASALSLQLLGDDEIATGMVALPSKLMGGAVLLPNYVAAAFLTRDKGAENEWIDRTCERMHVLTGQPEDKGSIDEIVRKASHAVRSVATIWDPWLLRAGVLVGD